MRGAGEMQSGARKLEDTQTFETTVVASHNVARIGHVDGDSKKAGILTPLEYKEKTSKYDLLATQPLRQITKYCECHER